MNKRELSKISLTVLIILILSFVILSFSNFSVPTPIITVELIAFMFFFGLRLYTRWSYIKKGQGILDKYLIDIVLFIIFAFVFTNKFLIPSLTPHLEVIPSCYESELGASQFKFRLENKADFADDNFRLAIKNVGLLNQIKTPKEEYSELFNSSNFITIYNESEVFYDENTINLSGKAKDYCNLSFDNQKREIEIYCRPIPPRSFFDIHFSVDEYVNYFDIEYDGEITPITEKRVICKKSECNNYFTDRMMNLWYFLRNKEELVFCYPLEGQTLLGKPRLHAVWMGNSPFYVHGNFTPEWKNFQRILIIGFILLSLIIIIVLLVNFIKIKKEMKVRQIKFSKENKKEFAVGIAVGIMFLLGDSISTLVNLLLKTLLGLDYDWLGKILTAVIFTIAFVMYYGENKSNK